ncbi:MAG: carbohydrate ABC transporter permease [Ruthenibacterium sp.]
MNLWFPQPWAILDNYGELIKNGGILSALFNSLVITISAVTLLIFVSAMAAFVIQRRSGDRLVKAANGFVMAGMFLPASMITTYFLVQNLHLNTSFIGIILVYVSMFFPLSVFLYVGYFKSIPRGIDESAFLDGCGTVKLFFLIAFPLVKPVTVTILIVNFMSIWNDFGVSIYFLNSPKKYTMTLTTFNYFGAHASDWNMVFADIVLISLPVLILYFTLQKHIVAGMTAGAIKA